MAARKAPWHGKVVDKLSVDQLAELFGLESFEKIDERNTDYVWEAGDSAYKHAIHEGESEKKAEKAREDAEGEAGVEIYTKWHDGVMAAAESLFGEHHLSLSPATAKRKGVRPFEYKVEPSKSWDAALKAIIETINGVGMFHFSSVREFLDSGPYSTPRIGVLTHLHHIASYPAVYGGTSAQRIFERSWR